MRYKMATKHELATLWAERGEIFETQVGKGMRIDQWMKGWARSFARKMHETNERSRPINKSRNLYHGVMSNERMPRKRTRNIRLAFPVGKFKKVGSPSKDPLNQMRNAPDEACQ
jgi:hypothetical protein